MAKYLTDEDIEYFFAKQNKIDKPKLRCQNCGKLFLSDAPGTKNRNHCPYCLYSVHIDNRVGDRRSKCGGLMKPIGKFLRPNGEEVIVHKCILCGKVRNNRVAGDDDFEIVDGLEIVGRIGSKQEL